MTSLFVYMNGYEVGEYTQLQGGQQAFIYTDSWLKSENATPLSLSLPLTSRTHTGNNVYNYFDNLLPDSPEIRNRIQAKFSTKTNQAFDLLTRIGMDCVGAIQLLSEQHDLDIKKIEAVPLSEKEIASTLRNYKQRPLGMSEDEEFRISIAGCQEKTALLWHAQQWQRPLNTTPTTHIFKLPIGKIEHSNIDLSHSVENEWLCMQILRGFDLPVPDVRILQFEDIKVLVVERFDRLLQTDHTASWFLRHPVEDMCQAHGIASALKYESDGGIGIAAIMKLLQSSRKPETDRVHFMRAVFVFWLLGAIDGHAKNFSIMLHHGGQFELAPFYDVLSAFPLAHNRQLEYRKLRMAMALHGKNTHYACYEILPRHWFSEAKRVNFPASKMQAIMDSVLKNLEAVIKHVSSRLPTDFPQTIADPIFEGMRSTAKKLKY